MRSPTARRLAGLEKARQRLASTRLCRLKEISARWPARVRSPSSAARMTRVSLNTRTSPGRTRSGRSRTTRSSRLRSCAVGRRYSSEGGTPGASRVACCCEDVALRAPGCATRSRAASRGEAGSSAMRSSGRSKSKRSVRMAVSDPAGLTPLRSIGNWGPRFQLRKCDMTSKVSRDLERGDPVGILHGLTALDLVHVLHALDHLAPDGVLPVQERCIVEADEELAVGAVRVLCTRHGAHAAHVRFGVELRGKVWVTRSAGAGALG